MTGVVYSVSHCDTNRPPMIATPSGWRSSATLLHLLSQPNSKLCRHVRFLQLCERFQSSNIPLEHINQESPIRRQLRASTTEVRCPQASGGPPLLQGGRRTPSTALCNIYIPLCTGRFSTHQLSFPIGHCCLPLL